MTRKIGIIALSTVVLVLMINTSSFTQISSLGVGYCEVVERFKIVDRESAISSSDIDLIMSLIGFGEGRRDQIRSQLSDRLAQSPITTLDELNALQLFGGSSPSDSDADRRFLLTIFFDIEGLEPCSVDSSADE